ncbi:hypothetical protein LTR53_008295 [Teratosphaeriaceae sp. CCFEE 6253]|nr:hypothetical protein LTR53_008295 [Teratosphaeriaceae sp. CCFEE 6253]
MSQYPMPPPPIGFQPAYNDDWPGAGGSPKGYDDPLGAQSDAFPIYGDGPNQLKTNKKNNKSKPASNEQSYVSYKGYNLKKADPRPGQTSTWSRVGMRELPYDDQKLSAIVRRQRTRSGPGCDFNDLSSNQQGVINRLLEQHNLFEKHSNASWVLADVQRWGVRHWATGRMTETKLIQVILKRQDQVPLKSTERRSAKPVSYYAFGEIIDLAEPLVLKKDKDGAGTKKSKKQQRQFDDDLQPVAEVYDPVGGNWDQREPVHNVRADQRDFPPQQQQYPPYDDPIQHMVQPLPEPVHYAQHETNQMPLPGPPHYPPPQAFPVYGSNPFQPNADMMPPSPMDQPLWPSDHGLPHARIPIPVPEAPKRSMSARRLRKVENNLARLQTDFDNLDLGSGESSEGQRDRDSVWSVPRTAGTRTPMSTPPMSEDLFPSGLDGRRRSKEWETGRRPRRYRDERKYRDGHVEIRAHSTYRPRREIEYESRSPRREVRYIREREREREQQYSPAREREPVYSPTHDRERQYSPARARDPRPAFDPSYETSRPPKPHRAQTYDDHPLARVVEKPRYFADPPAPLQRRLTDFPMDGRDLADFNEQHRAGKRRDSAVDGVYPQEREREYVASRSGRGGADEQRHGRQRSAVEASSAYWL